MPTACTGFEYVLYETFLIGVIGPMTDADHAILYKPAVRSAKCSLNDIWHHLVEVSVNYSRADCLFGIFLDYFVTFPNCPNLLLTRPIFEVPVKGFQIHPMKDF